MHFPMPDGDPCFFCEIVNGNTHQWQIVEEDELTITLLNGRQFEIGQCVVIPRRQRAGSATLSSPRCSTASRK